MNTKTILSTLLLSLSLVSCTQSTGSQSLSVDELETRFRQTPKDSKFAVYWYWISDNLSKEGIIKDLQAMKEAGINRAYIGNIGLNDVPYGKVKFQSEEWWDILHTALKTATDLGIEIGIFNSPGWSQSGGPWVKPEQSMRYLASSAIEVKGGSNVSVTLPVIEDSEDVRVLAYPFIAETKQTWEVNKKNGQILQMELTAPSSNMRSLLFKVNTRIKTNAEIYAKINGNYTLIKSFEIDRSNPQIHVGFDPYAPIVISLPENDWKEYKFVMYRRGECKASITLTSKAFIERYPEKSLAKMFQTPLPMWDDYLWSEQPVLTDKTHVVGADQVLDLTSKVKDGVLNCELPEGQWKITRFAMKTTGQTNSPATPEATGLEVDKMSKEHLRFHFDSFLGEVIRRIPENDRKSFKICVMDSYETGGLNWTDDMAVKFQKTYGYDPTTYLPVLNGEVIGSPEISDRFLWDLRRLIADRVSYDYVGGLREICHEHGLTTWLENYGHWGFPGEFLQYGGQSDEIGGEYWSEGSLGDIENRAASSCAHIYGKEKVWAESFTAGGKAFARYPYLMKQRGDRFFTEGINSTLLHLYVHQPYEDKFPGVNAPFSNEFNRKNTWYYQMPLFVNYLKRCNMMLQQGQYVADVAYFIGEDAPKMTGVTHPSLPKGYSFDYINGEVLLNQSCVENGCLTLQSGMKYRVLVLPDLKTMRPQILAKIKSLVNDGLIVLGPAPEKSPSLENYPEADTQVAQLASELWANKNARFTSFGKGKVYPQGTLLEVVMADNAILPDLATELIDPVLFIHRQLSDCDIYFVSNQAEKTIQFSPIFRIHGKQPELWNPLTSEIRYLTEYNDTETGTRVPLTLHAFESAFIVFRSEAKTFGQVSNYPAPVMAQTLSGTWKVEFINKLTNERHDPIELQDLKSWTELGDELKYFSGSAIYSTKFTVDKKTANSIYIDLGKVMVMANVKLNGKPVGGVWTAPYRVAVTDAVKEGENKLEVEVVNNWMNRIIGDLNLSKEQRRTWMFVNPWKADSPLQESGLLGPVQILGYDYLMPGVN